MMLQVRINEFQSTLPAKGETVRQAVLEKLENFTPLSPQRERLSLCRPELRRSRFQSTLPAKGETEMNAGDEAQMLFQSTLPAKGET